MAETSVTLPGINIVVITGYGFEPRDNSLQIVKLSRSSFEQQAGRVGRISDGKVYICMPENEVEQLPFLPEINIESLYSSILKFIVRMKPTEEELNRFLEPLGDLENQFIPQWVQLGLIERNDDSKILSTQKGDYVVRMGIDITIGSMLYDCQSYIDHHIEESKKTLYHLLFIMCMAIINVAKEGTSPIYYPKNREGNGRTRLKFSSKTENARDTMIFCNLLAPKWRRFLVSDDARELSNDDVHIQMNVVIKFILSDDRLNSYCQESLINQQWLSDVLNNINKWASYCDIDRRNFHRILQDTSFLSNQEYLPIRQFFGEYSTPVFCSGVKILCESSNEMKIKEYKQTTGDQGKTDLSSIWTIFVQMLESKCPNYEGIFLTEISPLSQYKIRYKSAESTIIKLWINHLPENWYSHLPIAPLFQQRYFFPLNISRPSRDPRGDTRKSRSMENWRR